MKWSCGHGWRINVRWTRAVHVNKDFCMNVCILYWNVMSTYKMQCLLLKYDVSVAITWNKEKWFNIPCQYWLECVGIVHVWLWYIYMDPNMLTLEYSQNIMSTLSRTLPMSCGHWHYVHVRLLQCQHGFCSWQHELNSYYGCTFLEM